MTEELEFQVTDEWQKFARENPWAYHIPEFAEDSEGNKFMRGGGRLVAYKLVSEKGNKQTYECANCGSEILGARVAHPIWDGPFPMSGSGECHYEQVPYCPKCEEKPKFHGTAISVGEKV